MQRNNNSIIWNPGELIYEIGSIPEEAYLILEGYVNIETKDQFKLNTLGKGEVFGESSLLLGTKRTVTARADSQKVVANIIPKDYFMKLKNNDVVLSALIRKTQVRLMDANKKINQLANEVSELLSSLKGFAGTSLNSAPRFLNISFFSQPRYGRLARTPAAISRSESESESVRERTEDPDAKRMVGGCGFSDDAAAGSSQAGDVLQGRRVD